MENLQNIAWISEYEVSFRKLSVAYFLGFFSSQIVLHEEKSICQIPLKYAVLQWPKVKELSVEYGKVLAAKKKTYAEYCQAENEAQELLTAQRNIVSL